MGLARARLVGRRVADDRLHADQRRLVLDLLRRADRRLERDHVVGVVDVGHVPAVRLEALVDVLAVEAQRGRAVERDVVVVVEVDDPAEAELAGERGRLGGDALHQVAVGDDRVDVVVLDVLAVVLAQELLGERHADAVREARAERAGRDLDAGRDVDAVALGVARGQRAPLAKLLELLHREVVARQVQDRVEQHRAVAGAEDEAVAIGPRRIGRVVAHDAAVQDEGGGRHGHRQAGMAGVRLLDRVHREGADGVDAELVGIGSHAGSIEISASRCGDVWSRAIRRGFPRTVATMYRARADG